MPGFGKTRKADDGLIASIKSAMLGRFLTLADSTIRPGTQAGFAHCIELV